MIIGFHSNQLSERGTEIALFDYAYYFKKLYGGISIIFYNKNNENNNLQVIKKFENEFKCYAYGDVGEIDLIILKENIDYFYSIKSEYDTKNVNNCPNLNHFVFTINNYVENQTDKYAMISNSLDNQSLKMLSIVPHMINLPLHKDNYRKILNIPDDAIVFGRYGGKSSFDLTEAIEAIIYIVNNNPNIYFLFSNTYVFYQHKQIIHLDAIIDLEEKVKFINTCDAMIHARSDGETFGLAIGEFSSLGKPIITTYAVTNMHANFHIKILGNKALIYRTKNELVNLLLSIKTIKYKFKDWNAYSAFTPEKVMKKWMNVFLNHQTSNEDITIVTAFYNTENTNSYVYINSFLHYLNLDYKMIVFVDDRYIDIILKYYNKSKYSNKIFIPIDEEWLKKNIYTWSLLEKETHIINNSEKNNPKYNIINHSKTDFITYAINNNLIKNDFICWSDFEQYNKKLFLQYTLSLDNFDKDKLNFILHNSISNLKSGKISLINSFFCGNKKNMLKLNELYHSKLNEFYNNNITDNDYNIYLKCYIENNKLFHIIHIKDY